jgi:two-component system phosphate regulon sensor histidine kinase PhoR
LAQGPIILGDLIAALPLPALAINRQERIFAINGAAEDLLGAGALNRHFVTALRQPALVEAVERALATGQPATAGYLAGQAQQNATYEVALRTITATGELLLTFQDVTPLAEAGQMRRDFIANVSHELRTPLTSLLGFIDTLRGAAKDDAAARERFLKIMAEEAERMNRLVDDLLSLNRVETDERVRPTARVDLVEVLQSTMRNLEPLAAESGVRLIGDLPTGPVSLSGDRDQLTQVFTNLVENGIKYGGPDKEVRVTAETLDRDPTLRAAAVRVTVADQGPGIDAHHLPRLTERFYRVDSHRSRSLGGTGLGLAIVKHILNRHRGRLRVESQPGQGSSFIVLLPATGAET